MVASGPDGDAAALDASAFLPLEPSKQLMKDFILDQYRFSFLSPIFSRLLRKKKGGFGDIENRGRL